MATLLKDGQQATAMAAMKEARAREAAQAMRDYEAKKRAVVANTARLRALRLAKESEDGQPTKAEDGQQTKAKVPGKQGRRSS